MNPHVHHSFPYYLLFLVFSELYGFLLHAKYVRNPCLWMEYLCFAIIFRTMGICFSHVLGTAWISVSCKRLKKSVILGYLCFPILFTYCGISLFSFPYFGNCVCLCFAQNMKESLDFGMFLFSHVFLIISELTCYMFWGHATDVKINKKNLFPIPFRLKRL